MKALDLTQADTRLAVQTTEFLCAIKFEQSAKASYERVVKLCKKSPHYFEKEIGERKPKLVHLVVFPRDVAGAKLAYAVLEEMRVTGWRYTLFANGRILKNKYPVINMLACFHESLGAKDYRAHCHMVADDIFDGDRGSKFTLKLGDDDDPEEPTEYWRLPCQMLDGFIRLNKRDEVTAQAKLQAVANKRCVDLCPRFNAEDFKLIERDEPKKGKKRYW